MALSVQQIRQKLYDFFTFDRKDFAVTGSATGYNVRLQRQAAQGQPPILINTVDPMLSPLTPNTGPKTGGTIVTIKGKNFGGAICVLFGGVAATFVLIDVNTIQATSPNYAFYVANDVDIRVFTAQGANASGQATFTYVP